MSTIVTLPSGGTVTLIDFADARGNLRGVVAKAVLNAGDTSLDAASISAAEKLAPHVIEAWSVDYLDAEIDKANVFDQLKPLDWKAALDAITPILDVLYPPKATPDDAGVPGTPTPPDGG